VAGQKASVLRKLAAAVVAVVVVFFLFVPLLHELLDVFSTDADSTDSLVRTIMEWALAAILVALLYACLIEGPRALARMWTRRRGVSRR
jgi:hypothetical protein